MAFGLSAGAASLIGGGLGLVGSVIGADGAKSAANAQVGAAQSAQDTQKAMYDQTRTDQLPYRQAGTNALSSIQGGFGLGPTSGGVNASQFTHQFDANDLHAGLAPNYDFRLQQGQQATNNLASVSGGLVGGNALKGIQDYTQNAAGDAYQQAYNNFNNNQTNIYNRLSNLAGLGQTANNATTAVGANYAGNIGSAQLAGGAAQAAGSIGAANAISGGLNNAAGSYYASQYLPQRSQVPLSAIQQANMSTDPIASLNESQGWTR